jgi:methylenetetrahydrofolate dehydrogenase (NADP+)/methenyltetrahydrofolate cyclohydrolase
MVIDGKKIALIILTDLKRRVLTLNAKNIVPHLYIITLTDDLSSKSYVNQKKLRGEEIGVKITVDAENPNIQTQDLVEKINKLNADNSVNGIIVQRPLPKQIAEDEIALAVNPKKDVDGFNPDSKFKTPVVLAVLELLKTTHPENFQEWLRLQNITVIGKGVTAGKPIINSLRKLGITPNIISSQTENPKEILQKSDIIISAVGKGNIFSESDVKRGVMLIGVGMHKEADGKFQGDFNEEKIQDIASFYTPTPGGVGPVNVAMLMKNLVEAVG